MRNIRSIGTTPERMVMRELRKRKIYFAKHVAKIAGKPDIVFRRKKVIVFIDSDFWHGHPGQYTMPKTNVDYWCSKIARNKERDIHVTTELQKEGWTVIRLWEHDIKKDFDNCINTIITILSEK